MNLKKLDNKAIGIGVGLIAPAFGMLLVSLTFVSQYPNREITDFFNWIFIHDPARQAPSLALGLLVNAGLFYLFYRNKLDKAAQGIIISMLFYAVVMVYLKYLR